MAEYYRYATHHYAVFTQSQVRSGKGKVKGKERDVPKLSEMDKKLSNASFSYIPNTRVGHESILAVSPLRNI